MKPKSFLPANDGAIGAPTVFLPRCWNCSSPFVAWTDDRGFRHDERCRECDRKFNAWCARMQSRREGRGQ